MPQDPLQYARGDHRRPALDVVIVLGVAACAIGVAATLLPLRGVLAIGELAPGTRIRPMGLTFVMAMCAGAGLLIAMPLAATCLLVGWRTRPGRWLGILGLLCAASAMFFNFRLLGWIVSTRGLIIAD